MDKKVSCLKLTLEATKRKDNWDYSTVHMIEVKEIRLKRNKTT